MASRVKRTIEDGLTRFELIAGAGSEDSNTACAMTLLAWVAGREWTDSPPCAHRLIRHAVVRVNDAGGTTPAMRKRIVKLGEQAILDTWWVPDRVIAWAFSHPKGEEPSTDAFKELLRALRRIAKWKDNKGLPPVLRSAVLRSADLSYADLRSADLSYAVLRSADLSYAVLRSADLSYADLRSADLSYADLSYAVLRSAVLRSADLAGARGVPRGGMPAGWKLDDSGLWVRA